MKLAIEHQNLADYPDSLKANGRYEWFPAHAYFSAETIHTLAQGEPAWDGAVASIARYHHGLVRDGLFPCEDYKASYVEIVKAELKLEFRCAPTGDGRNTLER